MIPLFAYMAFPAIFIFVIGHVATATLPLPKPKLSRKIRMIKFGNHSKTASKFIRNANVVMFLEYLKYFNFRLCGSWKFRAYDFYFLLSRG